jgi:hypothetical protein
MGRTKLTITSKKSNSILTRHLSSICRLSTASSKKDISSFDSLFLSAKNNQKKNNNHFHKLNSFNKKINGIKIESFIEEAKEYEKKKNNINENKNLKNRIALKQINDYTNRQLSFEKSEEKKLNKNNFRKIYSHEFMEFENISNKKSLFIKQYKEDDIPFTKSKILPEIQWQELDNDVETDDDQKKSAIRKEVNWLGETIKHIQENDKFFKQNVKMYKLSRKYPNEE